MHTGGRDNRGGFDRRFSGIYWITTKTAMVAVFALGVPTLRSPCLRHRKSEKGKTSMIIILCTLLIVATGGLYVQSQAMLDAQGGIMLLFVPFYQLVATGIGAIVAGVVRSD